MLTLTCERSFVSSAFGEEAIPELSFLAFQRTATPPRKLVLSHPGGPNPAFGVDLIGEADAPLLEENLT